MCNGTEAGGFNHGVAEVVAVFVHDLAAAQPDPQSDLLQRGSVVLLDQLLHGDGAGDARRWSGKDDHETVPEILDLAAAVGGDCTPEEGEVRTTEDVGLLLVQAAGELG